MFCVVLVCLRCCENVLFSYQMFIYCCLCHFVSFLLPVRMFGVNCRVMPKIDLQNPLLPQPYVFLLTLGVF